jgi:quercetin 2,3-dioxygenase
VTFSSIIYRTEGEIMTMAYDWEKIQGLTPMIDSLPGELAPYKLSAGEGVRFDLGDWHLTTMARFCDTADEFSLYRVSLPGGSHSPFITAPGHSFLHMLAGELRIWFDGEMHRIVAGDSVNIPAGSPFSIQADAVLNSFYWYSTDEWLYRLAAELGVDTGSHIFSREPQHTVGDLFTSELAASLGVTVTDTAHADVEPAPFDRLPAGEQAFVNKAGRGDRYETYQQVNTYPVRSRNNGGRFFAMDTRGAKTPYIPLHFHREHAENFFCMEGIVKIHANGQEIVLTPGDFLQAPAGTIHSFSHAANNTRMMGILNPPVFEKFFEYMNDPTDAYVHHEGGDPYFPGEGFARARDELDLVVVGPPPGGPQ